MNVLPQQQYGLTFDQTTGQLTSQTVETFGAGLSGTLTLYDGGRSRRSVRQAEAEVAVLRARTDQARERVGYEVLESFFSLLLAREYVEVERSQLSVAQDLLAQTRGLVEEGARAKVEQEAQEIVVAERRAALAAAVGAVELERLGLLYRIGLSAAEAGPFVGPSPQDLLERGLLSPPTADPGAPLRQVSRDRPDLRAGELAVAARERALLAARASGRPQVGFTAQVGTGYSSLQRRLADPDAIVPVQPVTLEDGTLVFIGDEPLVFPVGDLDVERTPFPSQFLENRTGFVGLSVTVPLLDGGASKRTVEEAQIRLEEDQAELRIRERQAAVEVGRASLRTRLAREQLDFALAQVDLTARLVDSERERFALRIGTIYDVLEAQGRLSRARQAVARQSYELALSIITLRLARGEKFSDVWTS